MTKLADLLKPLTASTKVAPPVKPWAAEATLEIDDLRARVAVLERPAPVPAPTPPPTGFVWPRCGVSDGDEIISAPPAEWARILNALVDLKAGYLRVGVTPGQSADLVAHLVDDLNTHNIQTMLVLGSTCTFANRPTVADCSTLAKRFGAKGVRMFELANEPNGGGRFSPVEYGWFAREVYDQLHADVPGCQVIFGAFAVNAQESPTDSTFQYAKAAIFAANRKLDVLSFHGSGSPLTDQDWNMWPWFLGGNSTPDDIRNFLNQLGLQYTPIVCTELDAGQDATIVHDALTTPLVPTTAIFSLSPRWPTFAMVNPDWTPRPSYAAFKAAA